MPFASVIGPAPAALLWAAGTTVGVREAGRRPEELDRTFAVLNGFFLSAVIGHFSAWPWLPNRWRAPWLSSCEGLHGRAMVPYNAILYLSALSALGALAVENRRGRPPRALVPGGVGPVVVGGPRLGVRRP